MGKPAHTSVLMYSQVASGVLKKISDSHKSVTKIDDMLLHDNITVSETHVPGSVMLFNPSYFRREEIMT